MQVLAQWTLQYGSVFKWNLAGRILLVITDPDEVYRLCSKDGQQEKPRFMYKQINTVSGSGRLAGVIYLVLLRSNVRNVVQREPHNNILATPDYQEWKYFRKMMNPAFSPENIRKVST